MGTMGKAHEEGARNTASIPWKRSRLVTDGRKLGYGKKEVRVTPVSMLLMAYYNR